MGNGFIVKMWTRDQEFLARWFGPVNDHPDLVEALRAFMLSKFPVGATVTWTPPGTRAGSTAEVTDADRRPMIPRSAPEWAALWVVTTSHGEVTLGVAQTDTASPALHWVN